MRVLVITPPQPVVSLDEAKRHLRLEQEDGDEDQLIAAYVAAAQGHIDGPDGWLGRAIGKQTLEARFDGCDAIRLPFPPVIELVSVSYLDSANVEQMADLDDIELRGRDVAALGSSWPWSGGSSRAEAVRVRYRAGYEVLPPAIRAAILLMTGDLYAFRETAVTGTISASVAMSTTVENLLSPFRVFSQVALNAGKLRSRVVIRRKVIADDGHGGQVASWDEVATVWAEAISQNGREAVIAGALQGVSAMRITMRWRPGVETTDQLRLDGRDYNIRTCEDPDGRRERLVIIADTASTE